jgi:hypothetical protein
MAVANGHSFLREDRYPLPLQGPAMARTVGAVDKLRGKEELSLRSVLGRTSALMRSADGLSDAGEGTMLVC